MASLADTIKQADALNASIKKANPSWHGFSQAEAEALWRSVPAHISQAKIFGSGYAAISAATARLALFKSSQATMSAPLRAGYHWTVGNSGAGFYVAQSPPLGEQLAEAGKVIAIGAAVVGAAIATAGVVGVVSAGSGLATAGGIAGTTATVAGAGSKLASGDISGAISQGSKLEGVNIPVPDAVKSAASAAKGVANYIGPLEKSPVNPKGAKSSPAASLPAPGPTAPAPVQAGMSLAALALGLALLKGK